MMAEPQIDPKAVLSPETLRYAALEIENVAPGKGTLVMDCADAWASELARREAAEEDRRRGDLFRFGDHSRDCRVFQVGSIHALPDDCSCGFWIAVGAPPYDVAKRAAALAARADEPKPPTPKPTAPEPQVPTRGWPE